MPMKNSGAVVEKLRERGFSITPQRLAILHFLDHNSTHPSALDIFHALKPVYPSLSPATVYNTLKMLKALGEVVEITGGSEASRYDANRCPHANLVCLRCHCIVDLDITEDMQSLCCQDLAQRSGFDIRQAVIVCHGFCPACRMEQSKEVDGE